MDSSTSKVSSLDDFRELREQRILRFAFLSYYSMLEEVFFSLSTVENGILNIRDDCGSRIERRVWKSLSHEEKTELTEIITFIKKKISNIEKDIIPQAPYKKKLPS